MNLNEYTSVDPSSLKPLMVKDYTIVIDNLCRRSMYSKRIYEKGIDYQHRCVNIFNWSILDSNYDYSSFEFDWLARYVFWTWKVRNE